MNEGFVAACQHCGAPQQIVLGGPVRPCGHCRAPEPLARAVQARVGAAANRIAKVARTEHRRLLRRRNDVETVIVLGTAAGGGSWLVIGGFAFYVAASELPEGVGVIAALLGRTANEKATSPTWVLFSLVLGLALSVSMMLVAFARARSAASPPRALPPLPGGAPRCRLCGAGLAGEGAVRTCGSCGARNLLDGRALSAHVGDLLEQLATVEAGEAAVVEQAQSIIERLAMFSALFPLLMPTVAFIVGEIVGVWDPTLMWLALAAAAPGAIALLILPFQSSFGARTLSDTRPGEQVRIEAAAYRVHAILKLHGRAGGCDTLHVLGPEGAPSPTLALQLQEMPNDATTAFTVAPGGQPLRAEDAATGALVQFPILALPGPGHDGERQGAAVPGEEPLRIFAAPAAPGAAPVWTLTPTKVNGKNVFVP